MSASGIEAVIAGQAALITALDAGDVAGIEAATTSLARAVASIRGAGGVEALPDTRARVELALRQSDAARTRVHYLADRTRQKIDRLSERRGQARASTYTARGTYAV